MVSKPTGVSETPGKRFVGATLSGSRPVLTVKENSMDIKNAVGMTLREVKEKLETDVRVMSVGPVHFMGTADYNPVRVNVELSSEGFTFTKDKMMIGEHEYEFDKVTTDDFDHGIVVRAWLG